MRGAQVLVTTLAPGRSAAARLVDGRLDDLLIDPPQDDPVPRPGAIYRGILGRPMKGMGGAMVDLGEGRTGFLRETRGLAPGRPVLVEVAGWSEEGKAPPLSRRPQVKGRHVVVTLGAPSRLLPRSVPDEERERLEALLARLAADLPDGFGLALRAAAADAYEEEIAAEVEGLARALPDMGEDGPAGCLVAAPGAAEIALRDWPDAAAALAGDGVFSAHGVWEEIDALRGPAAALPGGGVMYVETTRALTAVDVNTGADAGAGAAAKTNAEAVRALPRQLRLRGIGGVVIVDFAPIETRHRQRVADGLKAALARDPVATTIAGWTALGNLELSRKRARRPLAETLQGL